MSIGAGRVKYQVLTLVILVIAELEYLLVRNFTIRTELRQLFGLPIYHVLLTFFTLTGLVYWIAPSSLRVHLGLRLSPRWLLVHGLTYLAVLLNIGSIASFSRHQALLVQYGFWLGLAVWFMGSWLRSWLPWSEWPRLPALGAGWLYWVLPASVLAPYMAEFASSWWLPFARLTFDLTELILSLFYLDTVAEASSLLLGTTRFVVEIRPGCSGYEGMGLIAVVCLCYLWLKRKELVFPLSLILVPLAMAMAYVANIFRLVTLVVIGTNYSPQVALRGFHSQAGWLSFTLLSVGLVFFVERNRLLHRQRAEAAEASTDFAYPAVPYIAPLCSLLFLTMLVQAVSADFAYAYPLKPLVTGLVLVYFWQGYRGALVRPNWGLAIVVGLLVYLLWSLMACYSEVVSPRQALSPGWLWPWVVCRAIGSTLVVPLAEELAFRGFLLRRLQARDFETLPVGAHSLVSLLISSLLFAILHNEGLAAMLAGLAYGWVSSRPGALSNAVVAHMVTNACITVQVLCWGEWWLWV